MDKSQSSGKSHLDHLGDLDKYSIMRDYIDYCDKSFKPSIDFIEEKLQLCLKKTELPSEMVPVSFHHNLKKDSSNNQCVLNQQNQVTAYQIRKCENDAMHTSSVEIQSNLPFPGVSSNNQLMSPSDDFNKLEKKESSPLKMCRASSTMLIDTKALKYNLTEFHRCLKEGTKIMFMIKANSYGCDLQPMSQWLEKTGLIDYLAVAFVEEGVKLRQNGCSHPIMVLNVDKSSFEVCQKYDLQPVIYSIELLDELIYWIEEFDESVENKNEQKIFSGIHIEFDTGMCRLGLNMNQIDEFLHNLKTCGCLVVKSIFSHLVASEDANEDVFTENQANLFHSSAQHFERGLGYPVLKHLCNSPGIIRHHRFHFDMVRLGIGLYGLVPGYDLEPAVSLITNISQVHRLKKGESVSYNRRTIVDRDSWIGTIRIGFADGLKRQLGNGVGEVWVRNRRVRILGNICMDMTMIDLTDVTTDDGIVDEEVEIFGKHISIHEVAKRCNTIPSEIMTSMGQRVKRIYTEDT